MKIESKEWWRSLALQKMKKRWQERNKKCSILHFEQVAEKKKKEKITAHSSMIKAAILIEESHRINEAGKLADKYMNQKMQWSVTLILPL